MHSTYWQIVNTRCVVFHIYIFVENNFGTSRGAHDGAQSALNRRDTPYSLSSHSPSLDVFRVLVPVFSVSTLQDLAEAVI